jgi:excisionase family DNA binding protein
MKIGNDQNVSRCKRWLSPKEVADLLGLKLSWVYAQTRLKGPGSIPRLQCGKHIRFDLNEVIDWIDDKYGEKNENENTP